MSHFLSIPSPHHARILLGRALALLYRHGPLQRAHVIPISPDRIPLGTRRAPRVGHYISS
jgi:hypothetical protein